MPQTVTDFHTHTYRCQHAIGEVWEYAQVAHDLGFQVLGASDHTPLPNQKWPTMRMSMAELDGYEEAITKARILYPDLVILKGMECEFAEEFCGFYRDELLGARGFDYLIGGMHFFPFKGDWIGVHSYIDTSQKLSAYTEFMIQAMDSGLFAFIAHPDLFGHSYEPWDKNTIACSRAILAAAADLKIPLEINAYGFAKPMLETASGPRYRYPLYPFWELATEYDITVIINSDAHAPTDLTATTDQAYEILRKYQLKPADLSYLVKEENHPARKRTGS